MTDYLDLFNSHDDEMESKLAGRPRCACCGEPIQEEFAICIEGEYFCGGDDCVTEAKDAMWDMYKGNFRTFVA